MKEEDLKRLIEKTFKDLGFKKVGFIDADDSDFKGFLNNWLKKGFHADMHWMGKNKNIREEPRLIEPFISSFITLAFPYFTQPPKPWSVSNPISNYAWGKDYHKVLKKKLNKGILVLKKLIPDLLARGFVDSAPIPEKLMAQRSGLGWIGKNSLLITKEEGSYFFLAEIGLNLKLSSSPRISDHCGKCVKCIEACPTDAILPGKLIDSRRCIAWLTIEKKGELKEKDKQLVDYQIFGCDICQQVCPWNSKAVVQENSPFEADEKWYNLTTEDFIKLSEEEFETLKINSPLKRAGLNKLRETAVIIKEKQCKYSD